MPAERLGTSSSEVGPVNPGRVYWLPVAFLAILLSIGTMTGACTPAGPAVTGLRFDPDWSGPVPVDAHVHVVFDRPMDEGSLATAVVIAPGPANGVATQLSPDGRILVLTPTPNWQPGTAYQVTVATEAHDRNGRSLQQSYSGSFTTSAPRQATCSSPRVSPQGELVAWVEHDGAVWQCWVAEIDSPQPRLVYGNLWPDSRVEWLDETTLLAVLGPDGAVEQPRAGVIAVEDGDVTELALNQDLVQPGVLSFHVSPGGSYVAVQNDMYLADAHSDYQRQLGVALADGTGFRSFGNLFLAWPKDASQLLWLDLPGIGEAHSFDYTLYRYDLATGGSTAVAGAPRLNNVASAASFPDGDWIAFGDWRAEEVSTSAGLEIQRLPGDIWLIRQDGTGMARLTADQGRNAQPQWLSREEALVFASDRAGGDWDVWLLPDINDPATQVNLTARTGYDGQPQKGPGGQTIVFVSDASGTREVWLMSSAGDGRRMLSSRP